MWDLSIWSARSSRMRIWFSVQVRENNCLWEGKDILRNGSIEFYFFFLFQTFFFFSGWRFCVPRSLTGYDWFSGEKAWLHRLIQNPHLLVLKGLSFGEGKKMYGLRLLSQVSPFTTVPLSEDPSVARSGGNGRGFHCESKAASPVPERKGISRRWGKKPQLHLINRSQEVWRCRTSQMGFSIFLASWQFSFRAGKKYFVFKTTWVCIVLSSWRNWLAPGGLRTDFLQREGVCCWKARTFSCWFVFWFQKQKFPIGSETMVEREIFSVSVL